MLQSLTTTEHSRDVAGLRYVYPVMSRRAGGLSVGINLNPNNACNWRCIYCQVPNLIRGSAPELDGALLASELRQFLDLVQHGDFWQRFQVENGQRVIKDIAISGNGEATSLHNFDEAVQIIIDAAQDSGVLPVIKLVLISNGSLLHLAPVQRGLSHWNEYGGELWFKLDSATLQGRRLINDCRLSSAKIIENLQQACRLCRVKLQTCVFEYQDAAWNAQEQQAYLALLADLRARQLPITRVMLYSLARPSQQPEAESLRPMPIAKMQALADAIEDLGYRVSVSV